ncbi:hypothetical protein A3A54_01585 [Candidatus Curtissbacteria bacterium RIFCSPLOWO2_01_FULL_39_62]|uniref:Baseplate protein J-like domain-containing protein n=1 Tax=Candidatus Curtissbacteria bacterium RIFCSPHIGHO2_02_FULL_40_16b TaxID=1797714 RepID=A0A1F5G7M4_9BACT|nr:MAG: hypothetical protein A2775_00940 [Candidatus Curtissbacteria bacterium RIFCSPHIGHO2_01_FULL_39_57]OGD87851.1 MAG: hypothetical protein A3D04_02685 [Candidatus Curtissbacteria bacterium RIFCSPHIGHO2_02_FULL_40_16b]OGD90401.1 MAG: hypothetical protein A3E11_00095 [Candidatus Curtissbacteria bacterium RIFCSPHIGHO2_12_FULL_38_37]OGD99779.1 MAG: hypothetical protein A3J17_04320 [Candidatus Curtissbacteria bacterium RIFCSPLOWO2_02_FULL_40_11]OGE00834.1 MAG: hypothetical protein A3A54_01585 [C
MAIADIVGRFIKKESEEENNFLSLSLTPDRVLATIWALEGEKVEVLGFSRKSFQNIDSIIHQSAIAIDAAAEKAKSDVSQVVFGLSSSWFDDGKIKKDAIKLLKKLSQELELDSQAFVPLASSIKNYLKYEEGVTPHAVLIGAFNDSSEVHLLKNNEVEKTLESRSKPTFEKISELVKQLGDEKDLPLKIIVFGIPDDSRLAEEIQKHEWSGTFIHKPKVEFLKNRDVSKSVAFAQATDFLGHELSQAPTATAPIVKLGDIAEKKLSSETGELGFIEDEDILKKNEETQPAEKETTHHETQEDLAVEVDQNVKQAEPTAVMHESPKKEKGSLIENIATLGWFSKLTNIFKGPGVAKKLGMGIAILMVLGLVGVFMAGRTLTSAEVVIKVNAQSQEESFDVNVIKGASSDFSKQQIGGQEIIGAATGSRKAVATGTKELGEPAKGEVTIFNWTTSETTFSPGTVIISKNGIKFELDGDISVASRSASTPGESNIAVIAVDFGSEGNVGAGTDFTFQEFDELLYSGTNENSFSGGDEKEVTVVSQEDLDKLEESLLETLEENAISNLKEKLAGKTFSESSIDIEVTKRVFDHEVDKEASLVNLDMGVEATAIAYSDDDLKKLLAENVKEDAPQNLEAKADDIRLLSVDAAITSRGLNLTGNFEAKFVPKFEENDLKEKIAGKSVKKTREIIKSLPEVSDVSVNFSPSFFFASTLPINKEKITFKVET